jgi:hypothetical protein
MRATTPWRRGAKDILVTALGLALCLISANCFAKDKRPDCNRILTALVKGQSAEQIAEAMGIPTSTVYMCEKNATRSIPSASPSPGAMSNPSGPSHQQHASSRFALGLICRTGIRGHEENATGQGSSAIACPIPYRIDLRLSF